MFAEVNKIAEAWRLPAAAMRLLISASVLAFASSTPANMVVPSNSGTFTVSDLLPRQDVATTRANCPWDEPGLVAFPSDQTLSANTKYLLSSDITAAGTLTVPFGAELIFADASFELVARSIVINGRLRVGSPTCRTSAETKHIITLTGSRSDADSATVEHKGIVVSGTDAGIDLFGALHQPWWSRLAATASRDTSVLYLQ